MSKTQKTAITRASIAKNAIKYSFSLNLIASQLANKQIGINKVVSKK